MALLSLTTGVSACEAATGVTLRLPDLAGFGGVATGPRESPRTKI